MDQACTVCRVNGAFHRRYLPEFHADGKAGIALDHALHGTAAAAFCENVRTAVLQLHDQLLILRTLTDEPVLVDDLIDLVGIPARRVLSALTMLEIDEYVLQHPGKRYVRNVLLSE